jgi:hypothetical protein
VLVLVIVLVIVLVLVLVLDQIPFEDGHEQEERENRSLWGSNLFDIRRNPTSDR